MADQETRPLNGGVGPGGGGPPAGGHTPGSGEDTSAPPDQHQPSPELNHNLRVDIKGDKTYTSPTDATSLELTKRNGPPDQHNDKDAEAGGVLITPTGEKSASAGDDDQSPARETWGKKIDFLLSIIGFAVDLANVWRFPYLCYKNGGGAFLVPYFLMLIFAAVPLFMMELALGQFHREGAISVWKIAPIMKGVGLCQVIIAYFVAFYYNVIIAWSLYFLVSSFTWSLPWTSCAHEFNTDNCFTYHNDTGELMGNATNRTNSSVSAAAEYFERGVLGLQDSDGLADIGQVRWQLFLCLLGVFLLLYVSLWKGIKSSGKVVWVTATMPYVVLTILLFRGVALPGAGDGILYFITPNIERLGDSKVWIEAAIQIFYSCGAGFGVHIAFASYNKFHNNFYRDCLITAGINSFTSLFSGFVIFCYLGYMAHQQGVPINKVATEGPGLVFVVYPEAIATLPGSVGWSIIFFVMLITLGLDSAMGGLEAVLTGLGDEFKWFITKCKFGREIFTAVVCGSAMLFAVMNITKGGMYLFTLWDIFAAGTSILFGVFSLAVGIGWIYGLEQFCDDFEKMLSFRPNLYWRVCWKFISPTILFVVIVSSIATFKRAEYESYTLGVFSYPDWSMGVGWMIAASSMLFIPGMAIYYLLKTPGTWKQRLALGISPVSEHASILRGEKVKRFQKKHWLVI